MFAKTLNYLSGTPSETSPRRCGSYVKRDICPRRNWRRRLVYNGPTSGGIELGLRNPALRNVARIAHALGVPIADLFPKS
jgi:hypothetical protein